MPDYEDIAIAERLPAAARLALALAPPAAGLWFGLVTAHWLLALLLVLAYGGAVAGLRFAGEVARDLKREYRPRLVTWITRGLDGRFSAFPERYREQVLGSLRFIDQRGLATVGFYTPELDEVFVDVGLAFQAPGTARGDLLGEPPAAGDERRSLSELLGRETPVALAVIGAPGSGKTTLLRHTARRACAPHGRRPVPILLYLRDHAGTIEARPRTGLAELVRGTLGDLAAAEPAGWFEQRLRDGQCLVLLDGLDEIAGAGTRRAVAEWVERLIEAYGRNDFVITSRPQGYQDAPVQGVTVLQTRRFTDGQVAGFVRGWYRAVERYSAGGDGEDVRLRAEEGAAELLARLREAEGLYELTVNPLLLTMIANVHRYRGALPGGRADLYGEICQVMLWRRQEAKHLAVLPRGSQKETLLRALAYEMMRRDVRDLGTDEILAFLRTRLRRVSKDLSAAEFLADVSSNGLLLERENGIHAFAHLTFQEYLAAAHIRQRGLAGELAATVGDPWWRETTLLYVAGGDAGPIVRACLEKDDVAALTLAFDCAEEADELAEDLRDDLEAVLAAVSDQAAAIGRRRLAAAVVLNRHLRSATAAAGEGRRLCVRPVPQGVHRVFADEARGRGEDHRADAPSWADDLAPVRGVRPESVAPFLHWARELTGRDDLWLPDAADPVPPAAGPVWRAGETRCGGCGEDHGGGAGCGPFAWDVPVPFARERWWVTRAEFEAALDEDLRVAAAVLELEALAGAVRVALAVRAAGGPYAPGAYPAIPEGELLRAGRVHGSPVAAVLVSAERRRFAVRLGAALGDAPGEPWHRRLPELRDLLPAGWALPAGLTWLIERGDTGGEAYRRAVAAAVHAEGRSEWDVPPYGRGDFGALVRPGAWPVPGADGPGWPDFGLPGLVAEVRRACAGAGPGPVGEVAAYVAEEAGRVDPERARSLRLGAVRLAAEAAARGFADPDVFRRFAAGVTILERRLSSQVCPNETILLGFRDRVVRLFGKFSAYARLVCKRPGDIGE